MWSRLPFVLITLFWVTMNYLLWRSEFKATHEMGSPVPVESVWQKVLTAPDNSTLGIYHHGRKIGFCRWAANVGEELATGQISSDEFKPEGRVTKLTGYTLDLEGNFSLNETTNHLRFDLNLRFSTNHVWQELYLRGSMRPDSWELRSKAADQKVKLTVEDETGHWEKALTFSELQDPGFLLQEFGGPLGWALLGNIGISGRQNSLGNLGLRLNWAARNDWMKFGHSRVRVYRLQARVLDRFQASVFISRVGEILWVQLPDEIVLSNDAFTHF